MFWSALCSVGSGISGRLEAVIHTDGIARQRDRGAQPQPHCHTSTLSANRSVGSEIGARFPASAVSHPQRRCSGQRFQTAADLKTSCTELLDAGAHPHPLCYVPWGRESARVFRLALSDSRRLGVIHSNGDAQLLDVGAQPHPPATHRHTRITPRGREPARPSLLQKGSW